jgi:pimeloyl-ACP methyl ester carboxylesterase
MIKMPNRRSWVLLRGLVREQRHWGNFSDVLQTYFPNDEIILFDFPGNGKRNKENSATTITAMSNELRAYVSSRTTGQPVYIIALSMGAMVAVEWMNQHPEECAGAVLISTSLRGLNPFYHRLLPSNYLTILKSIIFTEDINQKENRILHMVSNIIASDSTKSEEIVSHWIDYAKQYPVSAINGLRQLIAAMRFHVPALQPDVPILVLRSLADHMVSPECSATLARHWHLPIETHATAGHDIPLDDAEWVCKKIVQWL